MVGDGHQRPQLEELSHSLGLADALTFTGLVENPLTIVQDFQVGVITSETEGFCNSILEYMACGVPVVATDTGGNRELVCDGENGFLVPVGDVRLMADKIELLLRKDALYMRMHKANLGKIRDDYSLAKMIASHQVYYNTIVGL